MKKSDNKNTEDIIENYYKILGIDGKKNRKGLITDEQVLLAYKKRLANLKQSVRKLEGMREYDSNLKISELAEAFYNEAYNNLATQQLRDEYDKKCELKKIVATMSDYKKFKKIASKTMPNSINERNYEKNADEIEDVTEKQSKFREELKFTPIYKGKWGKIAPKTKSNEIQNETRREEGK